MSRSKLIIDIDGVSCNHARSICSWINEQFCLKVNYEDVTTWDYDFGPITFTQAIKLLYSNDEFLLHMEATPGICDLLNKINSHVHVAFATARDPISSKSTIKWIMNNFGEYEVFFVKDKSELECEFLIDDSIEQCIRASEKGINAFLFLRPWNNAEFKRIDSHNELIRPISDFITVNMFIETKIHA